MNSTTLLVASMGLVTVGSTTFTLLLYRALEHSGDQAMVKMRLKSQETFHEFQAMKWAHIIQATGLFILGAGALVGWETGIMIGRISTVIQGAITIMVIARWWRRFR